MTVLPTAVGGAVFEAQEGDVQHLSLIHIQMCIRDSNCSYMTVSESEDLLTKKVGAHVLAIDTRNNGQESITAEQAGLAYDSDGSVGKLIRDQDRFTWFLAQMCIRDRGLVWQ